MGLARLVNIEHHMNLFDSIKAVVFLQVDRTKWLALSSMPSLTKEGLIKPACLGHTSHVRGVGTLTSLIYLSQTSKLLSVELRIHEVYILMSFQARTQD
jgi:hypothetical protein